MKIPCMKDLAEGRTDLWKIDPRIIEVEEGFNVRLQYGNIPQLMESILESGTDNITPLLVRRDGKHIILVHGHRRHRALMLAISKGHEIVSVPCQLASQSFSEVDRIADIILRNDGLPLTMLEMAYVVKRLAEKFGLSDKEIAKKLGRTVPAIKNLQLLLTVPEEVLHQVEKNKISASLVVDLTREVNGDVDQIKARVAEAIQTATDSGKEHASRKHVADPTSEETKRVIPAPSAAPDFANAPILGNGGGGPGSEKLSCDSTKNVEKLNKLLEKLNREECNATLYDFAEAMLDFLEGARPLAEIKKMIQA